MGRTAARRFLRVAGGAALIASVCDLILLYVTVAARDGFGTRTDVLLTVSGVVGTVSIPFYTLGYAAIARRIEPASRRLRRTIIACGTLVGFVGSMVHGATAILMHNAIASGTAWTDPLSGPLHSGLLLPTLWALATAAALCAAGAIAYAVLTGALRMTRALAVLNPPFVTVVIVAAALLTGSNTLTRFLAPAAPNLTHALFFFVAAMSVTALPNIK